MSCVWQLMETPCCPFGIGNVPVASVPMKLPWMTTDDVGSRQPKTERSMASKACPEMRFPSPAAAPPMVTFVAP